MKSRVGVLILGFPLKAARWNGAGEGARGQCAYDANILKPDMRVAQPIQVSGHYVESRKTANHGLIQIGIGNLRQPCVGFWIVGVAVLVNYIKLSWLNWPISYKNSLRKNRVSEEDLRGCRNC